MDHIQRLLGRRGIAQPMDRILNQITEPGQLLDLKTI